jgi:hypothetical protein
MEENNGVHIDLATALFLTLGAFCRGQPIIEVGDSVLMPTPHVAVCPTISLSASDTGVPM